jgi:hypothetical protein
MWRKFIGIVASLLIFVVAFYIKRDGESNAIWCFYRKRFILHGSFAAMAYRI